MKRVAAPISFADSRLGEVRTSLPEDFHAKEGIRFNLVAPGVVDTPMPKVLPRTFRARERQEWCGEPCSVALPVRSSFHII